MAENFPPAGYDALTFIAMLAFGVFGYLLGVATTFAFVHFFPESHRDLDAEMYGPVHGPPHG